MSGEISVVQSLPSAPTSTASPVTTTANATVTDASVKFKLYEVFTAKFQVALNRIPALLGSLTSPRQFLQQLREVFSTSFGISVSIGDFQFETTGLLDLAAAYFLKVNLRFDGNNVLTMLSGLVLGTHAINRVNGSLTSEVKIGLSAQGVMAFSNQVFRVLPGFAVERAVVVTVTAVEAAAAPAAASSTVVSRLAGGVPGASIMLGVQVMDTLNAVLAGVRHDGERRGRCSRFARGFVMRVLFNDEDSSHWSSGDRVFQQGVRAAIRAAEHYPGGFDGLLGNITQVAHVPVDEIIHFDTNADRLRIRGDGGRLNDAVHRMGEYIYSCIRTDSPPSFADRY